MILSPHKLLIFLLNLNLNLNFYKLLAFETSMHTFEKWTLNKFIGGKQWVQT